MGERKTVQAARARGRRREAAAWARIEKVSPALADALVEYLEDLARRGGEKEQ